MISVYLKQIGADVTVSTKLDPAKWARAKARAKAKMGGHSARAMQLATKYYKMLVVDIKDQRKKVISYLNGQSRSGKQNQESLLRRQVKDISQRKQSNLYLLKSMLQQQKLREQELKKVSSLLSSLRR